MTELYTKFTSNQNKGLIWNLLTNDGAFNNIPNKNANEVKEEFDRMVNAIAIGIKPTDNLIFLDKRVISEMMNVLKNYEKKPEITTIGYNTAEISQQRQKVFQNELTNKKKEFDTLNSTPTPEKIDFSDNLDAPMGSEMDKILSEQIALREKQLNMVFKTQDKEAAAKWIQNPSDVTRKPDEPPKLKIGENIQIDIKEPSAPKPKRVNFEDDANFLSLLKKKEGPSEEPSTLSLLREILDKQNEILKVLRESIFNK